MCHSTGFNRLGVSLLRAPGPEAGTLDPSEGFKPKAPAAALRKNVRRCGGLHALSSSAWAFRSRGRSYSRFPGTPSATTMCSSVQITLRERASVVATLLFPVPGNAISNDHVFLCSDNTQGKGLGRCNLPDSRCARTPSPRNRGQASLSLGGVCLDSVRRLVV